MKNTIKNTILTLLLLVPMASQGQLTVEGSQYVEITPPKSSGLDAVLVVEDCSVAIMKFVDSGNGATVERFSRLGGGYAEPQPGVSANGNSYTWQAATGGMGYIISSGTSRQCVWVADYASAPFAVTAIAVEEAECDRMTLRASGDAPAMQYYTVNGQAIEIDREIKLSYTTLEYSEDDNLYIPMETEQSYQHISSTFHATAPLCDTYFTLSPDRFARAWNPAATDIQSGLATTVAVAAHTKAVQTVRNADNEITTESENLGGSAPCEVEFSAAVSDAAIFRRWEISTMPDFENVDMIFDQLDFTYTFTDAGNTYIRFVANNAGGSCEYTSDTYTVALGESKLECPNAFSPGNQDGVNDEWKVSYSSIIDFHCEIFNRWGKKVATLTDPSQGWDGRVGGKIVGSGVYFYVINATGADGIKYKKSGDINVIGTKSNPISGTPADPME